MTVATLPSGDKALDLARSYGVAVTLKADGSGLILEADTNPPPDVFEGLRAAKAEILRILTGRKEAKAASESAAPPDCPEWRWPKLSTAFNVSSVKDGPNRRRNSGGRSKSCT